MKKISDYIAQKIFGCYENNLFIDYRFWLLLICLNTGANLGFNYLFPHQIVLTTLFLITGLISFFKYHLHLSHALYIVLFFFIFCLQCGYLTIFSFTTTLHYIMLISTAIMIVNMCRGYFTTFFCSAIFIYSIISLICYSYQLLGGEINYFPMSETDIDGGQVMRVYNLYYTQLGNPEQETTLNIRNCGPFWEPGAFQGFLNLALWFEIASDRVRDIWWKVRVAVFTTAVITTLSTGGYIVLFVILMYYFANDSPTNQKYKIFATITFLLISYYIFVTLDFMSAKLETNEDRLSFSFSDFPNIFYMLFGYGYAVNSFSESSITSASSVFSLFKYVGVIGTIVFLTTLLLNKTPHRYYFFVIVTLILMNEPFLSNALIWWGVSFVTYEAYKEYE